MGRSQDRSRKQVRVNSRERSRSTDRSRRHSRDRQRRQERDRSRSVISVRDRRRDYSRERSGERNNRKYGGRDVSVDSVSDERTRDRARRSRSCSSKEELRKKVKRLESELRHTFTRSAVDEYTVPVFDPVRDSADIEKWVGQVDRLARRYQWSDDDIIRIIARNLKGHAKRFYDEEQEYDHSWKSLSRLLIRQFRKPMPFGRLLKEAANFSARPGQKLGDYCFEKMSKLRALKLDIPDEYMEDAIISGIGDETIERTIRSNKFKDVYELYASMNEMGRMPQSATIKTSHRLIDRERPVTPSETRRQEKRQAAPAKDEPQSGIVCFNCGQSGHISRRCLKDHITCDSCKKPGHLAKYCQRLK
ncbi:RNA-binding protein 25-like [Ceratina calcarata]|uniref:RNA-binding protein 25-like n=1 Tax=Ceratina calcarata TaxID=156304 RepID=A0AAJ7RWC6_9HYME|nr:RNA-binding protein 25-like [Ceratina calcarata]XP_026666918.1 RNA-binding protein 25-like [Ceratina calcarata]